MGVSLFLQRSLWVNEFRKLISTITIELSDNSQWKEPRLIHRSVYLINNAAGINYQHSAESGGAESVAHMHIISATVSVNMKLLFFIALNNNIECWAFLYFLVQLVRMINKTIQQDNCLDFDCKRR